MPDVTVSWYLRAFTRHLLRNIAFMGAAVLVFMGIAYTAGWPLPGAYASGIVAGALASVFTHRCFAEPLLRRMTGRRKPDYARIRELEDELGITPEDDHAA